MKKTNLIWILPVILFILMLTFLFGVIVGESMEQERLITYMALDSLEHQLDDLCYNMWYTYSEYCPNVTTQLEKGELPILYNDGVVE